VLVHHAVRELLLGTGTEAASDWRSASSPRSATPGGGSPSRTIPARSSGCGSRRRGCTARSGPSSASRTRRPPSSRRLPCAT
jgi:hypothetical protein